MINRSIPLLGPGSRERFPDRSQFSANTFHLGNFCCRYYGRIRRRSEPRPRACGAVPGDFAQNRGGGIRFAGNWLRSGNRPSVPESKGFATGIRGERGDSPASQCCCGHTRGETAMSHEFSKIEEALEALAAGRLVIVVDDEDRENEGDFIAAAEGDARDVIAFGDRATAAARSACRSCPTWPTALGWTLMVWKLEHGPAPTTQHAVAVDLAGCKTGARAGEAERGPRPSGRSSTRPPSRATWFARGICSRWWPRRAASSAAPATRKRPSISPTSPACSPPASSARSSTASASPAAVEKLHVRSRPTPDLPILSIEGCSSPTDAAARSSIQPRPPEAEMPTRYGRGGSSSTRSSTSRAIGAGRHRHRRPARSRPPRWSGPLVLLHGRLAPVASAARLRRDQLPPWAPEMIRNEGSALIYLPPGGPGDRAGREDPGVQPPGSGIGYCRGQPRAGIPGGPAGLRRGPPGPPGSPGR